MLGPFSMKGLWVALGGLGAVLIRHNITPTHNHKALVGQLSISTQAFSLSKVSWATRLLETQIFFRSGNYLHLVKIGHNVQIFKLKNSTRTPNPCPYK